MDSETLTIGKIRSIIFTRVARRFLAVDGADRYREPQHTYYSFSVGSSKKASCTVRLMWPNFVIGNATLAAGLMMRSPDVFNLSSSLDSGQTNKVSRNALFSARALCLLMAEVHPLVVAQWNFAALRDFISVVPFLFSVEQSWTYRRSLKELLN